MNSKNRYKTKLNVSILFWIFIILLTYYHRNPTGDDAWFAEQSYWLQKLGIVRSNFFKGVLGWDHQLLVSHKLFLLYGAGLIQIFGHQLSVLQFGSVLFFGAIVSEICFYIYVREKATFSMYVLAILLLIVSNRLLIKMSFENRPEMMLAALGFGSFLLLREKSRPLWPIIFSGILAGLAVLSHLNGIIYLIAGAGTLFYLKQVKRAIVFTLSGVLIGLLYFLDVIRAKDGFSVWWYQFRHDPATQSAFGLSSKLLQLLTYPKLFFQSPEQLALSLLLVFLLWHQRRFVRSIPPALRIYSIILCVSFWIITKKNTGTYLVLFMPFMFALVYELYRLRPFINPALKILLVLYFIIGLYGSITIIYKNLSVEYLPVSYQKLRPHIPSSKGFVPITFFFNEYENFSYLTSFDSYHYYLSVSQDKPTPAKMANWVNKQGMDFILMDYTLLKEDFYPHPGTRVLPFYKLIYFDGRFALYSR